MRRAESLLRGAEHWVFAAEDARRLAAIRIGLCGLLALRLAIGDHGAVAGKQALFHPVFYMRLLTAMPSPAVATALQVGGIVAALAAAAGLALRASLSVALVCSLVLNGMLNSAGRVIVGDAVLTLCLLVLLACGPAAAEAWSLRGRVRAAQGERYGWPVRTSMIVVSLAYLFAGIAKWRHSGLAWVTSDNLRLILYSSSDGSSHPNGWALFIADRPLLAHLFAAGALLLETCFPLVLFVPRLRRLFIPAVVVMHVGIRLAMGLDYSAQWLTVLIVFVDWPTFVDRLRRAALRSRPALDRPAPDGRA